MARHCKRLGEETDMARKRKGEGQTALVTGASMGIGVDLAECFREGRLRSDPDGALRSALKEVAARLAAQIQDQGDADRARPRRSSAPAQKLAEEIASRGLVRRRAGEQRRLRHRRRVQRLGRSRPTRHDRSQRSARWSSSRISTGRACWRTSAAACSMSPRRQRSSPDR